MVFLCSCFAVIKKLFAARYSIVIRCALFNSYSFAMLTLFGYAVIQLRCYFPPCGIVQQPNNNRITTE